MERERKVWQRGREGGLPEPGGSSASLRAMAARSLRASLCLSKVAPAALASAQAGDAIARFTTAYGASSPGPKGRERRGRRQKQSLEANLVAPSGRMRDLATLDGVRLGGSTSPSTEGRLKEVEGNALELPHVVILLVGDPSDGDEQGVDGGWEVAELAETWQDLGEKRLAGRASLLGGILCARARVGCRW